MPIPFSKLVAHLEDRLAPIYVLSGDEPLQKLEAADRIRMVARKAGYSERVVLEVEGNGQWKQFQQEVQSPSLFAARRILDLRLASSKLGTLGSKTVLEYAKQPPANLLLLLSMPKLSKDMLKLAWVKAIEAVGVLVQIWPIDEAQLPDWIQQRMQALGLQVSREVAEILARHTEGNLLAARQEIEKLCLLFGEGPITPSQVSTAIADSARYDVYALVDAALAGRAKRCLRILSGLRAEGVAEAIVLWALAREIRLLARLAEGVKQGMPLKRLMQQARIWGNRQRLIEQAIGRHEMADWRLLLYCCQRADAELKQAGHPWLLLEQITLGLAGMDKALFVAESRPFACPGA